MILSVSFHIHDQTAKITAQTRLVSICSPQCYKYWVLFLPFCSQTESSVIFVNENENGEKRENNKFVNEN